ncbi:MAG: endonuclease III [Thermoplasmata archaeon]
MRNGGCARPATVLRLLRRRYPEARLEPADPFQTLIATVLSQRTREENTAIASRRLFERFPDAPSLASAPVEEVERLIKPCGFYRMKANTIVRIARELVERHGGWVPRCREELLKLPGVGRKTANCVLVYAFGIPAIPVDTHVHRISNRLGWVRTITPEETERELERLIPRNQWLDINELFVLFGRELCRPLGPRCAECPIRDCPSRGRLAEGRRRGRASAPGLAGTVLGEVGRLAGTGPR